jgi:hypothetical protein
MGHFFQRQLYSYYTNPAARKFCRGTYTITDITRGIFIFGGGNKRLRNVTKMYCQCQICHKRRKKECLGKFKLSRN